MFKDKIQIASVSKDMTNIYFQYNYHVTFWLLENYTTLLALYKLQIQIDRH